MKINVLAILAALGVFGFSGMFIWAALRPIPANTAGAAPTATASQAISEGLLDMQVYLLGNLDVQLEIQFAPDMKGSASEGIRPTVNFSMLDMHMDGFDPPLERVGAGAWRARFTLPMGGRWVASAGFGEERAEVEFDAR